MIDNLRELNDVVTNVANRIIEVATGNTSSGQYYVDYDDVSDLITYDDYLQYFDFIFDELSGREELLALDRDGDTFDVNCGLAWCKNYEPAEGEDFAYGYLDVRPAPSMAHLAEIGASVLERAAKAPSKPFSSLEDLGITESDLDYVKAYQKHEPQITMPVRMPDLPGGTLSYEQLHLRVHESVRNGSNPALDMVFNVYGQDISHPEVKEKHRKEFATLEHAMNRKSHISAFTRAGALLYGKPVLIYTLDLRNELSGQEYDPEFHAQTAMMSAHLKKALKSYNVNISYGIETGETSYKFCRPSDEIVAFVPANAAPSAIVQFEADMGKIMDTMPLTQDSSWVAEQYAAAMSAIPAFASSPVNRWLADHPSVWNDVAIHACEQLGARAGKLHEDILAARKAGDEKRLERIAEQCSFTAKGSKDYLESCISNASSAVHMDYMSPVVLLTAPVTADKHWMDHDHFAIPQGELKAMLPDLGYDADTSLTTFLSAYSIADAKAVHVLLEERKQYSKPTLDQQMKSAEGRRQSPEQNDKSRGKERGG